MPRNVYAKTEAECEAKLAELIREILPKNRIAVTIEKEPEKGFDYRRITIEGLDGAEHILGKGE